MELTTWNLDQSVEQGVNMREQVLDQQAHKWAQLQYLQSQVVDQILSGDTSQDWVSADRWLAGQLEEIEPEEYIIFESGEDSPGAVWAAYELLLAS